MIYILPMPQVSDFMSEGIIERLQVSSSTKLIRGTVLARIRVEIESADDMLECPPGFTFEIVAGETGYLREWRSTPDEAVPIGTVIAWISSEKDESLDVSTVPYVHFRYACRQVLE